MKIILINGQGGSGKTVVARALMHQVKHSAFIETDYLVSTNPWEFSPAAESFAIKNAVSLINNFTEAGFTHIFISSLTRNQKVLDEFLQTYGKEAEVLFVWLKADKSIRLRREERLDRDNADRREHFDVVDSKYPEIHSVEIKNGKSIFIDTSAKTIQGVVDEIKKLI